jgi:NAD(P)-dependent dehydrogenase (short-subunit alcohol dehydrogenase family)
MRGLEGKVVVVAGGATGIGAEAAKRLASEGARIVVGDINADAAEATAAGIRRAGGKATVVGFDIAQDDSCRALMERAVELYGAVDGLFNVAADLSPGTLGRDTDLLSVPLEVWRRTLDVNLTGYMQTARHAVPHLLARRGGAIVNTISGLVLTGDPARPAYGASKGGVVTLTKHIASRWGREGIRCNAVAPGLVVTEQSWRSVSDEEKERIRAMVRSNRLGRPEDIAAIVAFLISDDGSWINGQTLAVNGGAGLR